MTALSLLGMWRRLAQGHVALAVGCSCGVGVSNLRVADFEQDILEFLYGKHGAGWKSEDLTQLLTRISRQPEPGAAALLADLRGSIESFEQQHSGR
ncbi:MAG: hypothetical protein ACT4P4_00385 [Betaproteobacteria bacterium]